MDKLKIVIEKFHEKEMKLMYDPETSEIYVWIDDLLAGIGLVEKQIPFHRANWIIDATICKGIKEVCEEGKPKSYFLSSSKLPYGLAYFSTKSHMVCANPSIKEKLSVYKEEFVNFMQDVKSKLTSENKNNHVHFATTSLPLSREELAAFMLYEEQHVDILEKAMTGFMENQTKIMESFIKTQSEFQKMFQETVLAIMNSSRAPEIPEKAKEEDSHSGICHDYEWISKMQNKYEENRDCFGDLYSCRKAFRFVFEQMKEKGVDFESLKNSLKPALGKRSTNLSRINIVAMDKDLREMFEEILDNIISGKLVHTDNLGCMFTPNIIHEKLTPLVFEGHNSKSVQIQVYRKIEEYVGKTMKEMLIDFRKKTGRKSAGIGYMIANTPELLDLFDKAVKSFL